MPEDLWPTLKRLFSTLWPRFKEVYGRLSVLSVFILVGLWNVLISGHAAERLSRGEGLFPETLAELREVNDHLQLRFYQKLARSRTVPFQPNRVVLVYIDDEVYWSNKWGADPFSRSYLADLVKNASLPMTKANIIALDFKLFAPKGYTNEIYSPRAKENDALLKAIRTAANENVHVVLPVAYFDENDYHVRIPGIFEDNELPLKQPDGTCKAAGACVAFGFINAPDDRRLIPLRQSMRPLNRRKDKNSSVTYDSFALAIARAAAENHEMLTAQLTKTLGASGDPLGSFVTKFDSVPAEKLYAGDPKTLQMCRDSIVLIGGQWHLDSGYSESYNDAHFSPAGEISGLAFHANYVESLLNPNAVSREVPAPFAVILDIFIGMLIYAGFDSEHQWIKVLMLVVAFAIAPVVAYLALNLTNSYLDFLLPSELYFLHVLYEYIHQHL